jgi:hypothetical protein
LKPDEVLSHYDLAPGFRFAQYRFICAAMLFRHNGLQPWNYDICDTFWRLVKRGPSPKPLRNFESHNPREPTSAGFGG